MLSHTLFLRHYGLSTAVGFASTLLMKLEFKFCALIG